MSWRSLVGRKAPRRLRAGLLMLTALCLLCTAGSLFSADPTEIVDPAAASLLPPGSAVWIVVLADGSAVAAERLERRGDGWLMTRRGREELIPDARVKQVRHRRFLLGTDVVGRDVLARLLAGGRVSLQVGSLSLLLALAVGLALGLVAGVRGGLVDAMVMRTVDALLAIPMLFLLLLISALFRPSLTTLVVVLGFSSWMGVARLVRGQVLSLRERDFVLAVRGLGAGPWRVAVRHLLPNSLTPIAQDASLRLGDLILVEAALSFLGLGVQPPVPSWGNMVAEGQVALPTGWWVTFLPGIAIAVTVVGAALLADGLSELLRGEHAE